jgi:hypothetical protein
MWGDEEYSSMPMPMLPPDEPQPYLEIRERFERRQNKDFAEWTSDERSDLLSRMRLGVRIPLADKWRAEFQYQYAHDLVWTRAKNFSTENSDLSLAYASGPVEGGELTIGRQKIAIGDQRLIGPFEWQNVGRSFDGFRWRGKDLDLWGAGIGMASPRPRYARLAGAGFSRGAGQTNLVYKHDEPAAGRTDIFTLDHLWKGRAGEFNLEFEGAVQTGKSAGLDHQAWAIHLAASRPIAEGITGYVEWNAASGGGDPSKSRTFDQLYPTNHNKYGIADMQGWRNMTELAAGINWKPKSGPSVQASYHLFALQNARDAWYGAGGAPNRGKFGIFRDATGAAGKNVGQEFDLDLSWALRHQITFQAGLAIFDPGSFVRTLNGGDARRQTWLYAQVSGKL